MSMPTLTVTGQELYDAIAPVVTSDVAGYDDSDNGFVAAILCAAIATMVDPVSDVVRDQTDGTPGWAILFQPDIVPAQWLPWVAQFAGDSAAVIQASTVAAQRALVANPLNFNRGRPSTITQAAQTQLTGAKEVLLLWQPSGVPFTLEIITLTSQTPSVPNLIAAVSSVLPAWLLTTYAQVTGGTYATLDASHATYTLMQAAHTNYADIAANPGA